MESVGFETVLLRGIFYFLGNPEFDFKGPIRKGFRPITWIDSVNKATSCSFVSDGEILEGDSKEVDVVVLNQLALGRKIEEGTILNIGSTKHKIGEFTVKRHLGLWDGGKVP
jgi:hypothetical protein